MGGWGWATGHRGAGGRAAVALFRSPTIPQPAPIPSHPPTPFSQALYAAKVVKTGASRSPASPGAATTRRSADVAREVAIGRRLRHANVVTLREVVSDTAGGRMLLVMDYAEGGPVLSRGDLERGRRLPEATGRAHFRGMVAGLAYLHANRVVHGDIKPENVLMSARGVVQLSDFGCSKLMHGPRGGVGTGGSATVVGSAPAGPTLTTPAPFVHPDDGMDDVFDRCNGTPAFLAPEMTVPRAVYRGRPADVWALGACLYAFCFGRIPFAASSVAKLFDLVKTEPVRRGGGAGVGGRGPASGTAPSPASPRPPHHSPPSTSASAALPGRHARVARAEGLVASHAGERSRSARHAGRGDGARVDDRGRGGADAGARGRGRGLHPPVGPAATGRGGSHCRAVRS